MPDAPTRTAVCVVPTEPPYDHAATVAYVRIDHHQIPLRRDEAWELAWSLIGMCVEHDQARAAVARAEEGT